MLALGGSGDVDEVEGADEVEGLGEPEEAVV